MVFLTGFQGVLSFRQQHDQPGAFGRSDLYFICHMLPLTKELDPCPHEIEDCRWIDVDELARSAKSSAVTLRVLQLVSKGLADGFDTVSFKGEVFKSVFKGQKFKMFNRPVGELKDYASDILDSK